MFSKIRYSKYPNLVNVINNRYKNYNNAVEKIIDMENKKEIFVLRPSRLVKVKRIEKDDRAGYITENTGNRNILS